jgi:hypothetical protein
MQLCEDFNNCYPLLTGLKYPSRGTVPANKGCHVGFEASRSLEMLRIADLVTWYYMTEDMKMEQHCCVNLKSLMSKFYIVHTVHFLTFCIFKKPTKCSH